MIRHLNKVFAEAAAEKQKLVKFFRREMAGSGKRLATLVGCNYQGTRYELRGCINDVEAMRDTLVGRFGFDPDDVVVLTDAPGAAVVPTGTNVRRALGEMIDAAGPGDVLFFHYSGHGTLIPHGRNRRDEAIVPCDFNLITDVDFRQLVDRLHSDATLTIFSDSCHSGGLIDKEKEQIGPDCPAGDNDRTGPDRTRYIPFPSLFSHLSSLSGIDSPHVGEHLTQLFGEHASSKFSGARVRPFRPDAGILLSGCQTDETSADMPAGNGVERPCGAFSNAVQAVLSVHTAPLSNRELVVRAREALREQGVWQHPCLYCSDANADAPFLFQSK
ncbi:metacaspase-9 isoform X1 [Ananas comosus]|uniref:Metacaspase-9 isoform X1 n=2 Tax=Ananas comosus TaxID=4615 RepID=A0A6P5HLV5_ANACO|nr:metacaspase-9 isoform X1 [Ananas comosus]